MGVKFTPEPIDQEPLSGSDGVGSEGSASDPGT